ncbi:hypothetical protein I6M32_08395 [Shewanella algae]|uniref:hypothetical protein n=1 Tax=Shewanella algae TaxID=38313 RepID=UPI001AAC6A47|nr:hypothetical protein [Shewanella algae]MBO2611596.1 hypothetical protein [Shewanella algae]
MHQITDNDCIRLSEKVVLTYPPLVVLEQCEEEVRERQLDGAKEANLPFFEAETIANGEETGTKRIKLTGELFEGTFREPEAIKRFLIENGFSPESIDLSMEEVLFATHPGTSLSFMHWIALQLIHFQATGQWWNVTYEYDDYPDF